MQVFGKAIETRHGNFNAGDPLPSEWRGSKDTVKQLREKFGKDAVIDKEAASDSFLSLGERLSAIEQSLADIKDALGIKSAGDSKPLGETVSKSKGRA